MIFMSDPYLMDPKSSQGRHHRDVTRHAAAADRHRSVYLFIHLARGRQSGNCLALAHS